MQDLIIARYLFEQREDGWYLPKVSVESPGRPGTEPRRHFIRDPEGRTYRDLNRALEVTSGCSSAGRRSTRPACSAIVERFEVEVRMRTCPPSKLEATGASFALPSTSGSRSSIHWGGEN
jgi:hypothetical protein